MFREEIATIALERWCIPSKGRISWYRAHIYAVRKTITTLTKGWATEFILMNLRMFIVPHYEYYKNAYTTLKELHKMTTDLTIFNYIKSESAFTESMDTLIYLLSENEIYGDKFREVLHLLGYRHIEQVGGGEGGSEYCYAVFEIDGILYKTEYRYYSYNGHEYDGISNTIKIVTPKEKTITVYE